MRLFTVAKKRRRNNMKYSMIQQQRNKLPVLLKLALFISSYLPLFVIIIIKQMTTNKEYLSFGGINKNSFVLFIHKFGITVFLSAASIFGLIGILLFIVSMKTSTKNNGYDFIIKYVQNKNSESIGYIATYLFPFLFQSYSSFEEILCFLVLLFVIYIIYTRSTMIVVNPILNTIYSLYDIVYIDARSRKEMQGTFIIDCPFVEKGDIIRSKKLGSNLYFGILKEQENE
jgi:hypothetical protein